MARNIDNDPSRSELPDEPRDGDITVIRFFNPDTGEQIEEIDIVAGTNVPVPEQNDIVSSGSIDILPNKIMTDDGDPYLVEDRDIMYYHHENHESETGGVTTMVNLYVVPA